MIIYPPFIADTIPAFSTDKIVIPFQQNPAVSEEEFKDFVFKLLIKDFQSSKELTTLNSSSYDIEKGIVTFEFNKEIWEPTPGQYYKFQIAYNDGSDYFAYSSASIGRCVGAVGSISVSGLSEEVTNIDSGSYEGIYTTSILSEPVYSYRFVLTNLSTGEIIQDTGNVNYDTNSDTITNNGEQKIRESKTPEFKIKYELIPFTTYKLSFSITTVNGYTLDKHYNLIKAGELPIGFSGDLIATQDMDAKNNGYVSLSLVINQPIRGSFLIERSKDKKEWSELTNFELTKISDTSNFVWKDWSVEQGVEYIYALRQKSENVYSERLEAKPIRVEFEDMFLSDGKRQLKIQFNPKVSSFKDVILETKTDTIGSQYPFFFRNNKVKYKEIPISGLISYLEDDSNLFMQNNELGFNNIDNSRTTDLTNINFANERQFKLAVLEWLNNGELKLFRSPAEGNYVVRLMNTSLSPNDTVGRMLHTFSSTGYEVADSGIESLLEHKLIDLPKLKDPDPEKVTKTISIEDYIDWDTETEIVIQEKDIENIVWHSNLPGTNIKLMLDNKVFINTIGLFTTPTEVCFQEMKFMKNLLENGTITFQYIPILTDEILGIDTFNEMANDSKDIIFSAPAGTTLWGRKDSEGNHVLVNGEPRGLLVYKAENNAIKETKIYKTYALIVRKENRVKYNNYNLTFTDANGKKTIVDCSDGQIRYYYNLDPAISYEKSKGLHLDIYARVLTNSISPKLTALAQNNINK